MTKICLHCFVSGRVQGVFFRAGTQKQANSLGVNGWVRNTDDGRVEAMLCGEPSLVEAMRDWFWKGPKFAKVVDVTDIEVPCEEFTGFEQRQ